MTKEIVRKNTLNLPVIPSMKEVIQFHNLCLYEGLTKMRDIVNCSGDEKNQISATNAIINVGKLIETKKANIPHQSHKWDFSKKVSREKN